MRSIEEYNPTEILGEQLNIKFKLGHELTKAIIDEKTEDEIKTIKEKIQKEHPELADEIIRGAHQEAKKFLKREERLALSH